VQTVSIIITTKNRKEELRRALASCFLQQPLPEVVVIDDGSTDQSAEMVRDEFPQTRLFRSEKSKGLICQRNHAGELAKGDILVSLDDDAEFSSPDVVRQSLSFFNNECVAAVTIPWKNVPQDQGLKEKAPDGEGIYVCRSFTGLAHALRRDIFLQMGGYRESLQEGGEEQDLSIRMLDQGFVVCLGRADHVNHFESKVRSVPRRAYFVARNAVLFAWYYAPASRLGTNILGSVIHTVFYGFGHGLLLHRIRGLIAGFAGCFQQWSSRCPVSLNTYKLWRRLAHEDFISYDNVKCSLKPFASLPKRIITKSKSAHSPISG
jgi:glycosyltransferase involved in cell wall biosynthesis